MCIEGDEAVAVAGEVEQGLVGAGDDGGRCGEDGEDGEEHGGKRTKKREKMTWQECRRTDSSSGFFCRLRTFRCTSPSSTCSSMQTTSASPTISPAGSGGSRPTSSTTPGDSYGDWHVFQGCLLC